MNEMDALYLASPRTGLRACNNGRLQRRAERQKSQTIGVARATVEHVAVLAGSGCRRIAIGRRNGNHAVLQSGDLEQVVAIAYSRDTCTAGLKFGPAESLYGMLV